MSWRRFFRRGQRDADHAEELRSHIEIEVEENIHGGLHIPILERGTSGPFKPGFGLRSLDLLGISARRLRRRATAST